MEGGAIWVVIIVGLLTIAAALVGVAISLRQRRRRAPLATVRTKKDGPANRPVKYPANAQGECGEDQVAGCSGNVAS